MTLVISPPRGTRNTQRESHPMMSTNDVIPKRLFSRKTELPVSFASSSSRRTGSAPQHCAASVPTDMQHHTTVPRSHATAPPSASPSVMGGISAAAKRHTTTLQDDGTPAIVPMPQFQCPMSPIEQRAAAVSSVGSQTCASLAAVGLLSEETQTEDDGLSFQRSFNNDLGGNLWSGAPSPRAKGYKSNPSYLAAPHGGRSSATPTPTAAAMDADGALLSLMSDHHEQQRDRILMADLVIREAKLQQALQKMRVEHDKELAKEQDMSGKMEALASKNSDLLRAERLQHEVAMNEMRLAAEVSKKLIDALQQQLSNAQDEAQQLKHVITLQEEASVRAAKDQSKKIVEAMEKHLVRQHDESEQRNANRVADEQRRYQERREEWLRTMRKEGVPSPNSSSPVPHDASSPNLGSTSTLGSVAPGEAIVHSRSRNSSISTTGSASPLRLDGHVGGQGTVRSPRQALLQSSDAVPDNGGRRSSTQPPSLSAGLSPMHSSSPKGISATQPQHQLGSNGDRRKSSAHGSSIGRVITTAVNVRKVSKRLSSVLATSPSRQSVVGSVAQSDGDDDRWRSDTLTTLPPDTQATSNEELLLPLPTTLPVSRRSTVAPNSATHAPIVSVIVPPGNGDPVVDDLAARCLQGSESDASQITMMVPPGHTSRPAPSAAIVDASQSDVTEDASFLGLSKRGQRSKSLFSGDALQIMKEDMLSSSTSTLQSSGGGGGTRNVPPQRKAGTLETAATLVTPHHDSDGGGGSASTAQRQNWARRREHATKQLEAALGDVERLTTLLKERSAADTMVDAEQRLQQCSDSLKMFYDAQYTAAMEALKKREREIADLFTTKAASLEAELIATSATVHSLHVNVETLERENATLASRVRRAERSKDSSEKLEVLQRALLSVGQDHLCCLCRDSVLREEVNRCTATARTAVGVASVTARGSMQVKPVHLLPHSPSVDKVGRLSIAAAGGSLHRHSSGSARRPQTAGPAQGSQGSHHHGADVDLETMPGSAMAVITLPMSSSMNTPMNAQLMAPARSPSHVQLHHGGGAGTQVLIAALQTSQSPHALGFHEGVQEQLRTSGPPATLRLGPAN
jgi:hypothetical protein